MHIQAIQNVLDPEIQKHEVTMSMRARWTGGQTEGNGLFRKAVSATILPDSMDALSRLAKVLKQRQENIRIEGHTENIRIHNAHFAFQLGAFDDSGHGNNTTIDHAVCIAPEPSVRRGLCRVSTPQRAMTRRWGVRKTGSSIS